MVLHFIDRESEMDSLEKWHGTGNFELIVVYGRRRVGKTFLLKKFLEEKNGIYFLCDRSGTENNMVRFKREFARTLGENPIESNEIDSIFSYIAQRSRDRRIIVIDEFSYLVEKDESITSIFQRVVDEIFPGSGIMLILCGSSIGTMEEGVIGPRSPLFGRRSGQLKLRPIPFTKTSGFFPKIGVEDRVRINACFGSIPYYLANYNEELSLEQNLIDKILSRDGRLYEEINALLVQELREPDIYKRILHSIATGNTRPVHISNTVNISASDLSKYLNRLMLLGMISKEGSITDTKMKRPIYTINDNFINFWFNFCEPFKSNLEIGDLDAPLSYFRSNFNTYLGRRFEELVRKELVRKVIPFVPGMMGRFWNKGAEIDMVAIDRDKKKGMFIEVKWSGVDPQKELKLLENKVDEFPWKLEEKEMMIVARELKKEHPNCIELAGLMEKNKPLVDGII